MPRGQQNSQPEKMSTEDGCPSLMELGLEERTRSLRLTALAGLTTHEYMGKSFEELKLVDEEPERLGRDISACIAVHRIAKARRLGRDTPACIAIQRMSEGSEGQNTAACIDTPGWPVLVSSQYRSALFSK